MVRHNRDRTAATDAMKPEIVYANILGRTMRCEVVKTMKPLEDTDPCRGLRCGECYS